MFKYVFMLVKVCDIYGHTHAKFNVGWCVLLVFTLHSSFCCRHNSGGWVTKNSENLRFFNGEGAGSDPCSLHSWVVLQVKYGIFELVELDYLASLVITKSVGRYRERGKHPDHQQAYVIRIYMTNLSTIRCLPTFVAHLVKFRWPNNLQL